jgi:membrane-anchored protein YejM (alkaline phosphatase superfamily)
MFIRADGKYLDYLFLDYSNYHRYSFHLKKINGRYVSVPENLYYFVDSGHWVRTFAPVFAIWLLILSLFVFGTWLYRSLAEYRRETMEKPLPR